MSEVRFYNSKVRRAGASPSSAIGGFAKRIFDIVSASCLIVILSPLMMMVALLIIATEGRPFFIQHRRIGHNGNEFACFKFRTMVVNAEQMLADYLLQNPAAEEQWQNNRKLAKDPRITQVGHVLRKSSLDELPQLFNIIKGEMSLVGPRPIVRDESGNYGSAFQEYIRARPGLTGLWQVKGRSSTSYEDRVRLDCEYVSSWSFKRDIAILLLTVPSVLAARGSM